MRATTRVGGVVVGAGTVRECSTRGVRVRGLTDAAGAPAQPIVLDEVAVEGAPEGSVAGNRAHDVTVE